MLSSHALLIQSSPEVHSGCVHLWDGRVPLEMFMFLLTHLLSILLGITSCHQNLFNLKNLNQVRLAYLPLCLQ